MTRIRSMSREFPVAENQKRDLFQGRGRTRKVQCETQCFGWLVEHELRCAKRYRRFLTIVIGRTLGEDAGALPAVARGLRETDEVMVEDSGLTILMAETDRTGAWAALQRLRDRNGSANAMRFGVASYPRDGRDVDALLCVARGRLGEA